MPTWIKRLTGLVLALLLLALGAALLAPRLIDQQQLRRALETEIAQSLGRPTRIKAIDRLRLLPTPSIRLAGVRLLETADAGAPVWIALDSLRLDAALWPLLSGRLVLAEVLIDRPRMRLPVASGQQLATVSEAMASEPPVSRTTTRQGAALPAPVVQPVSAIWHALGVSESSASETRAPGASSTVVASTPALPPIRRLIIRDGQLRGPVESPGTSAPPGPAMPRIDDLNLTAGPLAPGQSGRLDATFTLTGEQPAFSLPGQAEAEIVLADPLTEVRLQPLQLRLGAAAGGPGLPVQVETEILIDLLNARVLLDPFELRADGLRVDGAAELYSMPAGLAMDAQMHMPPFDLRRWLRTQAAIALPGAADSLSQVGGQFELSLRGAELVIDRAVFMLDQTPVTLSGRALADALELEANADVYGGQLEARLIASQPSSSALAPTEEMGAATSAMATVPVVHLTMSAGAIDVAALLADLQRDGRAQAPLTGRAEIELDLVGRDTDPQAMLDTLGGEVAVVVRDGAVTMVDLGQLIIGTVGAMGVSREETEDLTRFSVLSLTARGADGRFRSEDIQLRSHLLAIDGGGWLELPTQQIALDLRAVMTKPPKGRGIKELEGIPIPISAKGPWSDPRWEVDINTALGQAARRALREDSDLLDELEERTGIKGLGDGLRQILPGLLGQ
ncbi:AsmA family protein [Halochromatium salexigens]|uniref:AsmA domain-containing protein n=1 Tax=Halochromatium salexigens TaxID=49447 RepID=A0AAJ0UG39_HALSE|nr:AsmA family protein [Halochromatium salexigens]MBK5930683.1 hypothetical protein [Halochromatium salexigens]